MKIEAGKFYRTRDGRKVGPIRVGNASERVWEEHRSAGFDAEWSLEGKVILRGEDDYGDLIAEWTDGPVRTVTRREVVSGSYGIVRVENKRADISIPNGRHSPSELRAAAAVLLELAGALDE